MPIYEIEHKWTNGQTEDVTSRMRELVANVTNGRRPDGVRPISIVGTTGRMSIHSVWEAPSEQALEALYQGAGLPTSRTIHKVDPYFLA